MFVITLTGVTNGIFEMLQAEIKKALNFSKRLF